MIMDKKLFLELINLAPTPDNCQPWIYQWTSENVLTIFLDQEKIGHEFNEKHDFTWISLGLLLHTIEVTAFAFGFNVQIQNFNIFDKSSPISKVSFVKEKQPKDEDIQNLKNILEKRKTYRDDFPSQKVLSEIEKKELLQSFGKSQAHLATEVSDLWIKKIVDADDVLWKNIKLIDDTFHWIHLSKKKSLESKNGIYWLNAGARPEEWPFMFLTKYFSKIISAIWFWGPFLVYKMKMTKAHKSSSGFIAFSVPNLEKESLVDLGRLSMSVWLKLTQMGYSAQPMTLCSSGPYCAFHQQDRHWVQTKFKKALIDLYSDNQKVFQVPDDRGVFWLFRFGDAGPNIDQYIRLRFLQTKG